MDDNGNNFSDLQGDILLENRQWKVAENGMESLPSEHHNGGYFISATRLSEPDWVVHMLEKAWIRPVDFVDAYYFALAKLADTSMSREVVLNVVNRHEARDTGKGVNNLEEMLADPQIPEEGPRVHIQVNEAHVGSLEVDRVL